MKRREAALGLAAAGVVVLALLTVFAIELSNTQAKSKRDVESRVHERGKLAVALINSLFNTVGQQATKDSRLYGTRTVSVQTLNKNNQGNAYLALLDSSGHLLAATPGFTPQARADLADSAALKLLRADTRPVAYGLGNVLPYGKTGVINLALRFPTAAYGERILLSGFVPTGPLSSFLAGELKQIPGVRGAHNYLIDGNQAVLASTNPKIPVGYVFNSPSQIKALAHLSGDVSGHYYDQVRLINSTWRVVLAAPDGPLFASVTGLRKWVPWAIFVAFALVALLALALARRALRSADQVRVANERLGVLNQQLATTNSALERRATELTRSNAELEQFASIASHDLQEPLRKVRTFTQQVTEMESEQLSDRGRDYLSRANGAAERMQKLIEDLLKFSRVATHGRPFASVDLAQVTEEVLEDLEAQVERSGAVVSVGELPTISADALQMRQLMQNLISNALKFRREGVTPEVTIDSHVADDEVQIAVRDNGIGFEPQYNRRIFRVFERLNGRTEYPGTGIGLALCRKIAERHGGSVTAESTPGAGSVFTVTLPLRGRGDPFVAPPVEHDHAPAAREDTYVPA